MNIPAACGGWGETRAAYRLRAVVDAAPALTEVTFDRPASNGRPARTVEQLQLETSERLEPALAFYMIVAWRLLFLTMLGRDCPEMPCNTVFADEE